MSVSARLLLALALAISTIAPAHALDAAPPATAATEALVPFGSDAGLARLARATAKADFASLANQFEAQSNAVFCGPTSAAIVLNAARAAPAELPRDRSRLRAEDLRHLPPGAELAVPRHTQDSVIEKGRKTRAQVLGEPLAIDGRVVRDPGYQLRQFDEMLRANGLVTRMRVVDATLAQDAVRRELAEGLARPGVFVVVNYRREAVGQRGGGHISPLAAYDAASDSFLVMDVNPSAAPWVWMPVATLVKGMRSFDTVENRGYVVIESR